jgi:hypothetical protein
MALQEFGYRPLHAGLNEFQLLSLQPGTGQDHIQCLLIKYLLDQAPAYEALSYAWGRKIELKPISVNGSVVHTGTNLYSAPRHLRRQGSDRILWIDAICINQNDNAEKNYQVRLMRRIYEAAGQVIVWLGEATQDTSPTLSIIKEMANIKREDTAAKEAVGWTARRQGYQTTRNTILAKTQFLDQRQDVPMSECEEQRAVAGFIHFLQFFFVIPRSIISSSLHMSPQCLGLPPSFSDGKVHSICQFSAIQLAPVEIRTIVRSTLRKSMCCMATTPERRIAPYNTIGCIRRRASGLPTALQ